RHDSFPGTPSTVHADLSLLKNLRRPVSNLAGWSCLQYRHDRIVVVVFYRLTLGWCTLENRVYRTLDLMLLISHLQKSNEPWRHPFAKRNLILDRKSVV